MNYCTGCGQQIHETAPTCPHCGAVQLTAKSTTQAEGTLWLPVPALICSLMTILSLADPNEWTRDEVVGLGIFSVIGLVLAGIGLARQERGRAMSIAALVLGVIGLMGIIGSQL